MALQWGIGHRLLVQAGLGILLVAGIVVVDRVSSHAVSGLTQATQRQGVVVENAIQLGALARRAQALAAETRLVVDPEGLQPAPGAIAALRQEADGFAEAALAAAASDEEREGLDKARGAVRAYLAAVEEIVAAQRDRLAARTAQSELSLQWDARMIDLSKHPKVAGNPDFELAAAQIGDLVKSARIAMWKLDATHDASLRASVLFTLADAEKRVKKLQGKISDGSGEDVLGLRAVIGKLRDGMGASADAEALQAKLVAEKLAPLRDQTNGQIQALQAAAHDRGTAARDELDRELSRTALVSSGLGLLTLLLLLGGALAIMLGVARPIRRIAETLTALVHGRRDVVVPFVDRTDEIGAAAQAAEAFRQNLDRTAALEAEERDRSGQKAALAAEMAAIVQEVSGVVQAAAHGDFSRRATARTSQPDLNALVDGINAINDAVDRATAEFADVLAAVARGDLTRAVQTPYAGRFDDLKASVNLMLERLSETVATIQATTAGVDGAAQDITAGAEDLSRRTEGQAASLEETAATTEELAASVKASAQASARAVTLAGEATRVAEHGGAIVREAVAAMGLIEDASRRISDITGVIDEIAFQTNLLALNAAVEAARAGDAGKGFAVVASEVRTLAQRSSAAAKDITSLIQSSTGQVSQGVELVRATGASLEQIVTAAKSVSATVGEIAAAAREQAGGIDEMSQSVAHMDEMTQRNAALADASARSAAALTEQVAQLSALVAGFRTRAGRPSAARAPRTAAYSMAS